MNLGAVAHQALDAHLRSLLEGRLAIQPPAALIRARDDVQTRYGQGQAAFATDDRVHQAVRELQKKGATPTSRHLFLLAHALTRPMDLLQGRQILESSLGGQLLDEWGRIAKRGNLRSSQWRGLFHSYLQAERGVRFERLRTLLQQSDLGSASRSQGQGTWNAVITRHKHALGDRPVDPYLDEMVRGASSLLDELTHHVHISDASWFWSEISHAAGEFANDADEPTFKNALPGLLKLQERVRSARDDVLVILLNRYGTCADRPRHPVLIERALEAWGTPQLKSNHRWMSVSKAARHMVCNWLAQEDLEDFYRLCHGDAAVDARRLEFWLRFTEQMGYTQILLGGSLRRSRDVDIREFIDNKGNRLGRLQGGPSSNNAILMQIGGWLFVEFSEIGHACQYWRVAGSLFELGRDSYSIDEFRRDIASPGRLLHMDGRQMWEEKFLDRLAQIGIRPDVPDDEIARSAAERQATSLLEKLRAYDVQIVDNRHKGGAIWAYPRTMPFDAYDELRGLGMKFKAEKKGFYWP